MYSEALKAALELEVIGQPGAVNAVLRGVTRVASGLTPRERPICVYLLLGPAGTGKTHAVRTLARALHGDEHRITVVDAQGSSLAEAWSSFLSQLAPLFAVPSAEGSIASTLPLTILLVENIDCAAAGFPAMLSKALEGGRLILPTGKRGWFRDCLVFFTSNLCSPEILDETIGFSGTGEVPDDGTHRLHKVCRDAAEKHLGSQFVGQLDDIVVFHRLEESHLGAILDRRFSRLNQWVSATLGFQCELLPAARAFLLKRGRRQIRLGARDLMRAHDKFVEFPLADLMISGRIPPGGLIAVDHLPPKEHLHFTVHPPDPIAAGAATITWDNELHSREAPS